MRGVGLPRLNAPRRAAHGSRGVDSAYHRRPRMKLYIRHAAFFHARCLSDDQQKDALEIMDGKNATLDLTARCQKCGALLKEGPAS